FSLSHLMPSSVALFSALRRTSRFGRRLKSFNAASMILAGLKPGDWNV
ncbi:uncharacterized protein METZ01_LOCUS271717, partial [marine metagenome]